MVTTIFRPPLPDMLSEMGSPVFSRGGMVPWKEGEKTTFVNIFKYFAFESSKTFNILQQQSAVDGFLTNTEDKLLCNTVKEYRDDKMLILS